MIFIYSHVNFASVLCILNCQGPDISFFQASTEQNNCYKISNSLEGTDDLTNA